MTTPRKRSKTVSGCTHRITTGCGNLYVVVNKDSEGFVEVFSSLGKAGQCGASQTEAICRCISAGLRCGVDPSVYVKQLKGIKCPSTAIDEGQVVSSCADAIANVLETEIKEIKKEIG